MTDFSVEAHPFMWTRVNVEEDNASQVMIHSMDQALCYIFALLNYRTFSSFENITSCWAEVWKNLFVMLDRFPEKQNHIVPFLFVSRLSIDTINEAINKKNRDETTYPSGVDHNALHYLFQLARKIDRAPENYMFGFIYSASDFCFLPVCASYCGMLRNEKFDEMLEQYASKINIPDQCLSENQPEKVAQQKDGVIIIGLLRARLALSKQISEILARGVRGRLLIQMHNEGVTGSFQPLDDSLTNYLRVNTNQFDHTLEWIQTFDLSQQMVVTVKEDFSEKAPQRSYLIMQPWKLDSDFWTEQHNVKNGCNKDCCKKYSNE